MIHCLARFQPKLSRWMAWRTVSGLNTRSLSALLVTDFRSQRQRPVALGMAEGARALVQQVAQAFGPRGIQQPVGRVGPVGAARHAVGPLLLEDVEGVTHRLGGAAQGGGDLGRPLALGAGQQDLAAAQRKGVPGLQAGA